MSNVKQIIRTIGVDGSVEEIDAYVGSYIEKGYTLQATHLVSVPKRADGGTIGVTVLYVLVK